jgi:hypothetical protein
VVEKAERDSEDLIKTCEQTYNSLHISLATGNLSDGEQTLGEVGEVSGEKVQNV